MNLPPFLTKYAGPSFSQGGSSSESYDYGGEDDLVKRQDAVPSLKQAKYKAIYEGDIPESVAASDRIRSLLDSIRAYDPLASELRPTRYVRPLRRLASSSSSTSASGEAAKFEGTHSADDKTA